MKSSVLLDRLKPQNFPAPELRPAIEIIVANISFVLNYTKTKAAPPASAIEYEKSFPTLDAALTFCVRLTELGGEALYILKLIRGVEDEVFEGKALVRSIDRQRIRQQAA